MREQGTFFVGIDWGNVAHEVALFEERSGRCVWETKVKNDAASLARLVEELEKKTGPGAEIRVGIERPDGPLVALMLKKGYGVFSINPRQMKHYRMMRSVSGAKDDRRDAHLLAEALMRMPQAFRQVKAASELSNRLMALVRSHTSMTEDVVRGGGKLRDCLSEYYPQFLDLTDDLSTKWVKAVFEAAPTPEKAKRLRLAQLKAILSKNSGRVGRAEELLASLQGPSVVVPDGHEEANAFLAGYLVQQLASSREALRAVEKQMDVTLMALRNSDADSELPRESESAQECPSSAATLVDATPKPESPATQEVKRLPSDAEILASLPGAGRKTQATLLGFAPHSIALREEYALRALSGVAPVTLASGKSCKVNMRRSCHHALRHAMHHWAANASIADEHFHQIFVRSRARGHTVAASYRRVGDALLKTLFAMLRDRTHYEPSRYHHTPEPGAGSKQEVASS